jgi:Electron transfer flavoprotein domain
MGPLCSQVRGLCGEDPRQPSADGDRHECEALHGAPVVFFLFTFLGLTPFPTFHCCPSDPSITITKRIHSTRLVRSNPPTLPPFGQKKTNLKKNGKSPFLAVEEAVRLRERLKDKVESITVVTLGPAKAAETLRTALAMGADSGVHIELPEGAPPPEPLGVARALRAVIERRGKAGATDLVIMGKQAIDDDLGQTGQMLAALLGAAQATCASKVDVDVEKRVVHVRTEVDGGAEELLCSLPAVVTTDLRCVLLLPLPQSKLNKRNV